MDFGKLGSAILSVVGSLSLVCISVVLGWYFVWKFFLSRFRLVRELLGQVSDESPSPNNNKTSENRPNKHKKARHD